MRHACAAARLGTEFQLSESDVQVAVAANMATHDHPHENRVAEETGESLQLVVHGCHVPISQTLNQNQLADVTEQPS